VPQDIAGELAGAKLQWYDTWPPPGLVNTSPKP